MDIVAQIELGNVLYEQFRDVRKQLVEEIIRDKRKEDLIVTKHWSDFEPNYFKEQLLDFLRRRERHFYDLAFYEPNFDTISTFVESRDATATHPTQPLEIGFNRIGDSISENTTHQYVYWKACNAEFCRFVLDDLGLDNMLDTFPDSDYDYEMRKKFSLNKILDFIKTHHQPTTTYRWKVIANLAAWRPMYIDTVNNINDCKKQIEKVCKAFPDTKEGVEEAFFASFLCTKYTDMDNKCKAELSNMFNGAWRDGVLLRTSFYDRDDGSSN